MEVVVRNNKGFSLAEMLIAVFLLAVSLFALCEIMVSSINVNLGNELRNTAVRLTNQTAEILYALPVDGISSCGLTPDPDVLHYNASYTYSDSNTCLGNGTDYQRYPNPVQSVKGVRQKFNITWGARELSSSLREITISVTYKHRGEDYINNVVIYKHRTL